MAKTIKAVFKIVRGLEAELPLLRVGELGYATDTNALFIGDPDEGNVKINFNDEDRKMLNVLVEEMDKLDSNKIDKPEVDGTVGQVLTVQEDGTNAYQDVPQYDDTEIRGLIPTKVSQLENDSNFLTTIPEEYVTETELDNKIDETKTELDNKIDENKTEIDNNINEINTQLDNIENEEIKNIKVPYDYNGAIVTFVVDDCKSSFLDIAKIAFDNKGVKCTLGIVPSWIDTSGYMTMEEIKQLKNEDYEFVSHSYTHSSSIWNTLSGTVDLSNVSDERIENDIYQAKKWIIDNKLGDGKTIVYPFGEFGDQSKRFKKLAKKYHENGINAVGGGYNDCPNDNMYLNRYFLNSTTTNVNVIRTMIDNAIANKQWLILGTHSLASEVYVAYIERIIEYCQENNVPVLTFSEALKYKGNVLSIGDYENNEKMFVAKNGKIVTKQETIENKFTNLNYTINSNWGYKANSSFFWNKGNEYFVNIILEKISLNGSFAQNEIMISKDIQFTGTRNTLFDAIVVSSTGVVTRVPFWVKLKENKVEISMFDNYSGENDIRWISFNCNFIA